MIRKYLYQVILLVLLFSFVTGFTQNTYAHLLNTEAQLKRENIISEELRLQARPERPGLNSPDNNASVRGKRITFKWNPVANATLYQLEIRYNANNTLFKRINIRGTTNTTRILSDFPNDGTVFKWRVRARNLEGFSPWSTARRFTNGLTFPGKPALISPADDSDTAGTTITFRWQMAAGANSYQLRIWDAYHETVFHQVIIPGGANTSVSVDGFPNDGSDYEWEVRARNAAGFGPWSDKWFFLNGQEIDDELTAPSLLTPADNETIPGNSIDFTWSEVAGASRYQLEIYYHGGALFTLQEVCCGTSAAVAGFPANNTLFDWRVRALDSNGQGGPWSNIGTFVNGEIPAPGGFYLTWPDNNDRAPGTSITFQWTRSENATHYSFWVLDYETQEYLFRSDNIGNVTSYTVHGFTSSGRVYDWGCAAHGGSTTINPPWKRFVNGL